MPPHTPWRFSILAGAAAVLCLIAPSMASAQDLIDFLWGGGDEWGGPRQVVSFDPKYPPGQIIVSFGDRRLYLITRKGLATSYPIAVPREQSRWEGATIVSDKKVNPSWRPTPDMMKENPRLPSWVPSGHPMNPLGVRALYLGASTYRIHGTDAPWTIGQAVSKGCIRMFNEDVLDLYPRVQVGTKVTVTWDRFNTSTVAAGELPPEPPMPMVQPEPEHRVIRNLPHKAAPSADTATAETPPAKAETAAAKSASTTAKALSKSASAEKDKAPAKPAVDQAAPAAAPANSSIKAALARSASLEASQQPTP